MGERLRTAIARALDEEAQSEHDALNKHHGELMDQRDKEQRERDERELRSLERVSAALQSIAESLSRISCSGLNVHGLR